MINLWLDRGLQGILGPHIDTREEAERLVAACLFPTAGRRSWGGGRGTLFNEDAEINARHAGKLGFATWTNENMIVEAQIESKTAYDNLDAILSVPGLHAIAGGPNDFAASLGHPGEPDHPERQRLSQEADDRARAAGKQAGGDSAMTLSIQELLLSTGREFVRTYAGTK